MVTPCKKYITSETKIGFTFTAEEQNMILDFVDLEDEYERAVRATPVGEPISLTLDQWDDFSCYIAAEANHVEDEEIEKKLFAIFDKVERILETYTAHDPKRSSPRVPMMQESGHSVRPYARIG